MRGLSWSSHGRSMPLSFPKVSGSVKDNHETHRSTVAIAVVAAGGWTGRAFPAAQADFDFERERSVIMQNGSAIASLSLEKKFAAASGSTSGSKRRAQPHLERAHQSTTAGTHCAAPPTSRRLDVIHNVRDRRGGPYRRARRAPLVRCAVSSSASRRLSPSQRLWPCPDRGRMRFFRAHRPLGDTAHRRDRTANQPAPAAPSPQQDGLVASDPFADIEGDDQFGNGSSVAVTSVLLQRGPAVLVISDLSGQVLGTRRSRRVASPSRCSWTRRSPSAKNCSQRSRGQQQRRFRPLEGHPMIDDEGEPVSEDFDYVVQ